MFHFYDRRKALSVIRQYLRKGIDPIEGPCGRPLPGYPFLWTPDRRPLQSSSVAAIYILLDGTSCIIQRTRQHELIVITHVESNRLQRPDFAIMLPPQLPIGHGLWERLLRSDPINIVCPNRLSIPLRNGSEKTIKRRHHPIHSSLRIEKKQPVIDRELRQVIICPFDGINDLPALQFQLGAYTSPSPILRKTSKAVTVCFTTDIGVIPCTQLRAACILHPYRNSKVCTFIIEFPSSPLHGNPIPRPMGIESHAFVGIVQPATSYHITRCNGRISNDQIRYAIEGQLSIGFVLFIVSRARCIVRR